MKKGAEYRSSTLAERKKFYSDEFSLGKIKKWFEDNGIKKPQICALDAGTDTGIIINKKWKGIMFYFTFNELKKQIKRYVPEDVYYDRNVYENPKKVLKNMNFAGRKKQELVFDVDADNIKCRFCKKEKVCNVCLKMAYKKSIKLKNKLNKIFKKIILVYSGKGFHLHILDKKAWVMKDSERRKLNEKFKKFPIDKWVSAGGIRLIRMPYSLNALVSRIVTPLGKNEKLIKEKTIPKFMKRRN